MKKSKILSWVLVVAMLASMVVVPAAAADAVSFPDMEGHWSTESVDRWSAAKIFQGDENGNFNPDRQMTRAEFATVLANMMGYTVKAENVFTDVAADAWYADAVLKLAAAGVLQGSEGLAMPEAPISREQAAVMLCRAFSLKPSAEGKIDFADSESVSDWAKDAVAALSERAMISGVEDGSSFAPALNINRASVAKLLDNMISTYVNTAGATVSGEQKGIVVVAAEGATFQDAKLAENVIVAPAAAGTVTLAGSTEAANVIVAAEGAKVVVNKTASAGNITVEAPKAAVTVAGKVDNVTVAETAEGAALTVQNGATVANVETSADKVTVDGAGKIENLTVSAGEGVEVSKDTTVNKVDNKTEGNVNVGGSTVGGGSTGSNQGTGGSGTPQYPTTSYDLVIGSKTVGQGTVKLTNAKQKGDSFEAITVEATPAAGWKLQSVSYLANDAAEGTAATTVSMTPGDNGSSTGTIASSIEAGKYTLTATFVQPSAGVVAFVAGTKAEAVDGIAAASGKDKAAVEEYLTANFAFPEADAPWLMIFVKKGTNASGEPAAATVAPASAVAVTINGATVSPTWGASGSVQEANIMSLYVNGSTGHDSEDRLGYTGAVGEIVVKVTVDEVVYTAEPINYVAPGVEAADIHTITFDQNYTGAPAATTIKTVENQAETAPTVTRTHYTFGGWYSEKACSTQVTDIKGGETDITLYAKWTANNYTLSFDLNGGTGAAAPENISNFTVEGLPEGTTIVPMVPSAATKAGYTRTGNWVLLDGDEVLLTLAGKAAPTAAQLKTLADAAKAGGNTVTLKAEWKAADVTVTFKAGEETVATKTVAWGGTIDPATIKYTSDLYQVSKWMMSDAEFKADTQIKPDIDASTETYSATVTAELVNKLTVEAMTRELKGTDGFGANPPKLADIQSGLEVGKAEYDEGNGRYVFTPTGTLNYYAPWEGFSSVEDYQAGYYVAVKLAVPKTAKTGWTVKLNDTAATMTAEDLEDGVLNVIIVMADATAEAFDGTTGFKFDVDWDSEDEVEATTYVVKMTAEVELNRIYKAVEATYVPAVTEGTAKDAEVTVKGKKLDLTAAKAAATAVTEDGKVTLTTVETNAVSLTPGAEAVTYYVWTADGVYTFTVPKAPASDSGSGSSTSAAESDEPTADVNTEADADTDADAEA